MSQAFPTRGRSHYVLTMLTLQDLIDHDARLHAICRKCCRYVIAPQVLWARQHGGEADLFALAARLRCKVCGIPLDVFLVFDAVPATRAFDRGQPPKIKAMAPFPPVSKS